MPQRSGTGGGTGYSSNTGGPGSLTIFDPEDWSWYSLMIQPQASQTKGKGSTKTGGTSSKPPGANPAAISPAPPQASATGQTGGPGQSPGTVQAAGTARTDDVTSFPWTGGNGPVDPYSLVNDPEQLIHDYLTFRHYPDWMAERLARYDSKAFLSLFPEWLSGNRLVDLEEAQQLGAMRSYYDALFGSSTRLAAHLSAPEIIRRVAAIAGTFKRGNDLTGNGASPASDPSALLDDYTMPPEQQVENVKTFLLSVLQGVVPREILVAYANLLDREGNRFVYYRKQVPPDQQNPNLSFLRWLVRVYGNGLGLL